MFKKVLMISFLFLLSCSLILGGGSPASAAEKAPEAKAVETKEPKQVYDAHESYVKYHFDDMDMDFNFGSFVLGGAVNHAVEIGEAFRTVANIKDGDAASWQAEWAKIAALVQTRGEQSLAGGHKVSARDQFQRASNYWRLALLGIMPDDARLKEYAKKSRDLMKKAGELFEPPMEYVEIPFEGTVLPGFFRKAVAGDKPNKTLIMIGGGETFAEDLIFYIAPQTFDRGFNFMTVDLPGQGLLPLEGKPFRPDMNVPMKAVIDYVLSRKDVDAEKLAVYGYSGGGGFVPQAAQHDPRIKAIAMNACVVDGEALFSTMPVVRATKKDVDSWSSFHRSIAKLVNWRWGIPMDNPADLAKANKGFCFDPEKVTVPALLVCGEGEYKSAEVQRQHKLAMDKLPNPLKKLVITPGAEGASGHCVMENRSLVGQIVFDWLEDIFK